MEFEFVSGDVALDFVGTVAERDTAAVERLVVPADLASWLLLAGVVTSALAVSAAELARARRFRETVYQYVRALTDGTGPTSAQRAALNRVAAGVPPRPRLTPQLTVAVRGDVDAALASVAAHAIALADPALRGSLRWCAGQSCTRVFLDRSRGPSRRWCGMAGCGNRAKAAAFRTRHATNRGAGSS